MNNTEELIVELRRWLTCADFDQQIAIAQALATAHVAKQTERVANNLDRLYVQSIEKHLAGSNVGKQVECLHEYRAGGKCLDCLVQLFEPCDKDNRCMLGKGHIGICFANMKNV